MDKNVLVAVGQRIRDLRKQRGLSQEQLGEIAGFHFSYIGGVERAEKNISLLNLQKISDALGVHIYELFQYSSFSKKGSSEKIELVNEITNKLLSLRNNELKKIKVFIEEFFK